EHDAVFQEFRQTTDGARQAEGTGLGLALVKRFVELHDGHVHLESARGRGSTFTVVLPLNFRGADEPVAQPAAAGQAVRVLVVEDDALAWRVLSQQLSAARFLPIWARSG